MMGNGTWNGVIWLFFVQKVLLILNAAPFSATVIPFF